MAFEDRDTKRSIIADHKRDDETKWSFPELTDTCCFNCKYWDNLSDHTGDCHRYPPQLSVIDTIQALAKRNDDGGIMFGRTMADVVALDIRRWDHPLTRFHNWCGEFQRADWVNEDLKENQGAS